MFLPDGVNQTFVLIRTPILPSQDMNWSHGRMELADLPLDHPGYADASYRERRAQIAAAAPPFGSGGSARVPDIEYSDDEHRLWSLVSGELAAAHRTTACRAFLAGCDALALPRDHVPPLSKVDARLTELSGFGLHAVPGLVPTRAFYELLERRLFPTTQYLRHPSVPRFTPEPDLIHELMGHAQSLADPTFASLYRAAGAAAGRAESEEALDALGRILWFTIEFGVVVEGGVTKAWGAGILSSVGEIGTFMSAKRRPFDLHAMVTIDYDYTKMQPVLFEAPSWSFVEQELGDVLDQFDDEYVARRHLVRAKEITAR